MRTVSPFSSATLARETSERHGQRKPRPIGLEEHVVRVPAQKALARKDQPHPRLDTHEIREISILGVHEQVVELEIPREIVAHDVKAPNRLRQRGAAGQGAHLGGNGGGTHDVSVGVHRLDKL